MFHKNRVLEDFQKAGFEQKTGINDRNVNCQEGPTTPDRRKG